MRVRSRQTVWRSSSVLLAIHHPHRCGSRCNPFAEYSPGEDFHFVPGRKRRRAALCSCVHVAAGQQEGPDGRVREHPALQRHSLDDYGSHGGIDAGVVLDAPRRLRLGGGGLGPATGSLQKCEGFSPEAVTLLSPFQGCLVSTLTPGLAPRALFFRRFAALTS